VYEGDVLFVQPTGCVFACLLVTWLVAFRDWKFGFSGESFNYELDSTFSLCWMCMYSNTPCNDPSTLFPRGPRPTGLEPLICGVYTTNDGRYFPML